MVPDWPAWPLPLYELALMTAERVHSIACKLEIAFITPEGRPLKAFGRAAGDAIVRRSSTPRSTCTPVLSHECRLRGW